MPRLLERGKSGRIEIVSDGDVIVGIIPIPAADNPNPIGGGLSEPVTLAQPLTLVDTVLQKNTSIGSGALKVTGSGAAASITLNDFDIKRVGVGQVDFLGSRRIQMDNSLGGGPRLSFGTSSTLDVGISRVGTKLLQVDDNVLGGNNNSFAFDFSGFLNANGVFVINTNTYDLGLYRDGTGILAITDGTLTHRVSIKAGTIPEIYFGGNNGFVNIKYNPSLTGVLLTDAFFDATTWGLATKQKAGAPVDGDYLQAPPNGTLVVDSTNNKLWARVGNVWKGVAIA